MTFFWHSEGNLAGHLNPLEGTMSAQEIRGSPHNTVLVRFVLLSLVKPVVSLSHFSFFFLRSYNSHLLSAYKIQNTQTMAHKQGLCNCAKNLLKCEISISPRGTEKSKIDNKVYKVPKC